MTLQPSTSRGGAELEIPRLVQPVMYRGSIARIAEAATQVPGLQNMRASRCIVNDTGVLTDLAVFVGTQNGNIIAGVYDTGDAVAGSRTLLYSTGSLACPAPGWAVLGTPGITVVAGQELDFALIADAGVAAFAGSTLTSATLTLFPTNFIPVAGGASPKLNWTRNPGSFSMPAAVTEAQCVASGIALYIMARVV